MTQDVRVRFAPSPTGMLHIGGLRTALYDYIYAKKMNGKFILRIEDTDRNRYQEEAVQNLIDTLNMMGLYFDEGPQKGGDYGPYIQSERLDLYQKYVKQLIENGSAYYCFCSKERLDEIRNKQKEAKELPKYDGKCLNLSKKEVEEKLAAGDDYVIRLKIPQNKTYIFDDAVRGKVQIESEMVDDQILMKSDGFPTYHLAAVVDDHLMKISHVIRGEEWITSTPKHIQLYESFGWEPPKFVHLPLILNEDKKKLSKRHGDFSVKGVISRGYLKEAVLNFISMLGWHPKSDEEIFTLEETIEDFTFDRVNKAGAVFDEKKLNYLNGWYIRNITLDRLAQAAKPFFEKEGYEIDDTERFKKILAITRDYPTKLDELVDYSKMFFNDLDFTDEQKEVLAKDDSKTVLNAFKEKIKEIEKVDPDEMAAFVKKSYKELGVKGKNFYHPLRLSLYGKTSGPEVPALIEALGKDAALNRLSKALAF